MQIYEYLCPKHARFTGWSTMSERHQPQACPKCSVMAPFAISAPRVFCDFPAYVSPATGKMIEGRKARVEDLKESGCRPYEEGEMREAQVRAKLQEAKDERAIDEAVEQTIVEIHNA